MVDEFILSRADTGEEMLRLHGDLVLCSDRKTHCRINTFRLSRVRLLAVNPDGSITVETQDL